jgi:hypothetical protein
MTTKARLFPRFVSLVLLGMGLALAVGLLPFPAFAQDGSGSGNDLKGTTSQVATELVTIPRLIAMVAYVIGTFFAAKSLFALRRYIDAPDDNPINRVIGFGAVSALLIALPYSIGLTTMSLAITGQYSLTNTSGSFASGASCAAGSGIGAVFCNIVAQVRPFAGFLAMASYVIASALLLTGLLNLKAYGDDPSQMPLRSIVVKFVLATMLFSLPLTMQLFVTTVTGAQSISTSAAAVGTPQLYKGSINQ